MEKSNNENKTPMDFFGEMRGLNEESSIEIMETVDEDSFIEEDEEITNEVDLQDEFVEEDEVPLEDEDVEEQVDEGLEESEEDLTGAAILAKAFVEEGVLPEDFKFDNNITGADLKKALYDEATSNLNPQEYFESLGYNKKVIDMASNIVSGIDPNMAFEANRYEAISKADLDANPEYAESILRLEYADRGLDESTIEDLVATKVEKGEEIEEAKKVQARFAEKAKNILAEERQKVEKAAQKREELKNQVIDVITKGNFSSGVVSTKERKELNDYIYKPTETVEQNVNGKTVKTFVSKFKKDFDNIFSDPKEFVKFANTLKSGWDIDEKKKSSKVDAAISTIDALNRRISNKKSHKKDDSKVRDIFNNMAML